MYIQDGAAPGGAKRMRTGPSEYGGTPPAAAGADYSLPRGPAVAGGGPPAPRTGGGLQAHDNPPCNTLFVGNLGPGVTETELRQVFSVQPVGGGTCGRVGVDSHGELMPWGTGAFDKHGGKHGFRGRTLWTPGP